MTTTLRSVAAFEIPDVAIVRQDFRPEFEVRGGLEDGHLRCLHDDGISGVHVIAETLARIAGRSNLAGTDSNGTE